MPTFVYSDEELVQMVSRQIMPTTVRRFHRLMNNRMARDTVQRRLSKLAKDGLILSRKFFYSRKELRPVQVYGTGTQMAELDRVWSRQKGILGLAKMEDAWYV